MKANSQPTAYFGYLLKIHAIHYHLFSFGFCSTCLCLYFLSLFLTLTLLLSLSCHAFLLLFLLFGKMECVFTLALALYFSLARYTEITCTHSMFQAATFFSLFSFSTVCVCVCSFWVGEDYFNARTDTKLWRARFWRERILLCKKILIKFPRRFVYFIFYSSFLVLAGFFFAPTLDVVRSSSHQCLFLFYSLARCLCGQIAFLFTSFAVEFLNASEFSFLFHLLDWPLFCLFFFCFFFSTVWYAPYEMHAQNTNIREKWTFQRNQIFFSLKIIRLVYVCVFFRALPLVLAQRKFWLIITSYLSLPFPASLLPWIKTKVSLYANGNRTFHLALEITNWLSLCV